MKKGRSCNFKPLDLEDAQNLDPSPQNFKKKINGLDLDGQLSPKFSNIWSMQLQPSSFFKKSCLMDSSLTSLNLDTR